MLLGQHTLPLGAENNIELPDDFQVSFSGSAFITQGFDRNLLLLTDQAFKIILEKLKALNIADPLARLLLRMIIGTASRQRIDKNGRIYIPAKLKDYADLGANVTLIGQGDFCEVWSPENWSVQQHTLQDTQENSDRFSVLQLNLNLTRSN